MEFEEIIQLIPLVLQGKATAEQEQKVRMWLDENEDNGNIYREVCETYYKLQYLRQWNKIDMALAIRKARLKVNRKTTLSKIGYWFSGVAALFLICMSISLFMRREEKVISGGIVVQDIKSGEKKALLTLADGRQITLTAENKVDMDLGAVRAVEKDSSDGLVYQMKDSLAGVLEYHQLNVPRAGEYIMTLSDGTKVWLNSETEMRYPVVFGVDKREVFITGEAFFEVVKDPKRPFVVHTSHTQTTVLGTSFNVMAYAADRQTEITLVTGRVDVSAGNNSCRITPGHQVAVNNESLQMQDREVNVAFYTSWKEGLFDFENMTLNQLCVQLSRWYDMDFFFVNQSAAEKRFTGAIKRNNTLRFMLDFVEKTSNVRFEVSGKTVSVYNR